MPAGLQIERPAHSREARGRHPVPRKWNSSARLAPNCRAASVDFMANAGGNTLKPAGANPARRTERFVENPHQSLSPFNFKFWFCDECRWNYILKEDEVPGSNPGGSNGRGHSSTEERVKYVSSILSSQFLRRMPEELHVIRWSPVRIRPPGLGCLD